MELVTVRPPINAAAAEKWLPTFKNILEKKNYAITNLNITLTVKDIICFYEH